MAAAHCRGHGDRGDARCGVVVCALGRRDGSAARGELQASIADWSRRGGRIQLSECGNAGQRKRLCVRVDAKAGRCT